MAGLTVVRRHSGRRHVDETLGRSLGLYTRTAATTAAFLDVARHRHTLS